MRLPSERRKKYAMIVVAFDELKQTIDPVLFAESRVAFKMKLLKDKILEEEGIPVSYHTIHRALMDRKNIKFEIEAWKSEKSSRKITGETNS